MNGWVVLILGAIVAAILTGIIRAALRPEQRYIGRHRPIPARLDMQRASDVQARADDQVIAELEAMLQEQSR